MVLEAQGRELCPGPFLPTVAAAVVIDRCGPDSLRAQLLPGLADGGSVGALGLSGSVSVGSDLVVTGESPAVLGAPDAGVLVISAGEDVVVVDAGAEGVTVTALESLDTTRSIGSVALRGITLTEDREAVAKLRSLPSDKQRDFLVDSGYLVPHWPKPWGRGADVLEQLVIEEEFGGVDIPDMGITGWVTLTIAQAGADDQRGARAARPGDVVPAVLRTGRRLGRRGGAHSGEEGRRRVRVTGQKVWTSLAQMCDWGLATVRTDPDAPKHAGVTMMAIDMKAPGVTVNPLRGITGDAHFNEVFFDDVFVPDADVVGDVNRGWLVARATLGNERISIGGGSSAPTGFTTDDLIKNASLRRAFTRAAA